MARILIAEHNASTADYLYGNLKKAGNAVEIVDNSLDAWRLTHTGYFDVLMIDIVMPGIDAFVLAQKALQENPDVQIIFITGFAGVAMDAFAHNAHAMAPVTSRPFHLREIACRVRYLMGQGGLPFHQQAAAGGDNVIYANFAAKTNLPHQAHQ